MNELPQFINHKTPDGWLSIKLKRALNIKNGRDHKPVEVEDGYPVIGSGGHFTYANDFLYNGEAILLGQAGTLDKPIYVNGPFWAVNMFYGIPQVGYYPKFIYYCTKVLPFDFYQNDTAVPSMPQAALNNHKILVPIYNEQKEIANFLDQETTRIDQLIEKKETIIQILPLRSEALIDSELSSSETKWLRFRYAMEAVSRPIKRKDTETYIAIGLYNHGRGVFHKEETYGRDLGDSTFNWIKENDLVFSGQFSWEGAVALASEHEYGKIASHRYPIYNARSGIETAYVFSYFRTHRGKFLMNDCSRGAAGRNRPLNINRLEKELIPILSKKIQTRITELVKQERDIKSKIVASIKALKTFKTSLITEAVTGQLDIEAWKNRGTGDSRLDKIEQEMGL